MQRGSEAEVSEMEKLYKAKLAEIVSRKVDGRSKLTTLERMRLVS